MVETASRYGVKSMLELMTSPKKHKYMTEWNDKQT